MAINSNLGKNSRRSDPKKQYYGCDVGHHRAPEDSSRW